MLAIEQTAGEPPLRALVRDPVLGRAGAALALYRLAEFGPWIAILVFAYGHGGATATGLVSLGLLVPTALAAPLGGPVIDRYGAGRVLAAAYAAQALAMGATAASMLAGAPPLVCYALGAATATLLTVTYPAHAVMSPAIAHDGAARRAQRGHGLDPQRGTRRGARAGRPHPSVATPGAVYAAGALCLGAAAMLVLPLRTLAPAAARSTGEASRFEAVRELNEATRAILNGGPVTEVMLLLVATFGAIAPLIVLTRLRRLLLVDAAATVPVVAIALLRSMRLFRACRHRPLGPGRNPAGHGGRVLRRLLRDRRRRRRGDLRRAPPADARPRRGIR
jgi:hypothetical protein